LRKYLKESENLSLSIPVADEKEEKVLFFLCFLATATNSKGRSVHLILLYILLPALS